MAGQHFTRAVGADVVAVGLDHRDLERRVVKLEVFGGGGAADAAANDDDMARSRSGTRGQGGGQGEARAGFEEIATIQHGRFPI